MSGNIQLLQYNDTVGKALKNALTIPNHAGGNTDTSIKKQTQLRQPAQGVGSKFVYDGPFAVFIDHPDENTPEDLHVVWNGGFVSIGNRIYQLDDRTTTFKLENNKTLYAKIYVNYSVTSRVAYLQSATTPSDTANVIFVQMAKNVNGELKQIQYGGISSIDMKLIAGTSNVTLSPSEGRGQVTINVSGSGTSGTGGLGIPPYSVLYISGHIPEYSYGQAVSFVIPVKAGTVGIYDDGGGAAAVYASADGSVRELINISGGSGSCVAPSDGWLRVSVYDIGQAPGACLSFSSATGGIPLYKYTFKATGLAAIVSGGTAFCQLVTGGTFSRLMIKPKDNSIEITQGENGEIEIRATGGTATTGVSKIIAGSNKVSVSPSSGTGNVTIDVTGSASGLPYPNYGALCGNDGALSSGQTYYTPSGGWLRVSAYATSSSTCIALVVNGSRMGISDGRTTFTNLYPIPPDSTFAVDSSVSIFVKFDGTTDDSLTEYITIKVYNQTTGIYSRYTTGDIQNGDWFYAWKNASNIVVYTDTQTPSIGSVVFENYVPTKIYVDEEYTGNKNVVYNRYQQGDGNNFFAWIHDSTVCYSDNDLLIDGDSVYQSQSYSIEFGRVRNYASVTSYYNSTP